MFKQISKLIIGLGFGAAVALMLALTFIGISRMYAIKAELETIVHKHNVQTEYVTNMRTVARERVISLFAMTLLEDAFEKDEAFLHYHELANDFVKARTQLEAMQLNRAEREVLQESLHLIGTALEYQEQVVNFVARGETDAAHGALLQKVIPMQDKIFVLYSRLLDMQRDSSRRAVSDAEDEFRFATLFMLLSGATAVLLALGIAVSVIRRTRKIEDALFQEKELAQVTLYSIGDAVITTNGMGQVDYLNSVAETLTGWTLAEARGQPLRDVFCVVDEATREQMSHLASHALPDGQVVGMKSHSLLVRRGDGQEFVIEDRLSPICNRSGDVIGAVVVFHDVSHARQMANQLSWQAAHDALTGLANRREFERLLQELIDSAAVDGKHHAVLFMDLDQFKVVTIPVATWPGMNCCASWWRCLWRVDGIPIWWRAWAATSSACCSTVARWNPRYAWRTKCARGCSSSASCGRTSPLKSASASVWSR